MPAPRDISSPPPGWSGRKAWSSYAPSYRRQMLRAHERGYTASVFKMREARRLGKETPSDRAARAEQRVKPGRYVADLAGGAWNFYAAVYQSPEGRARLAANMRRAARLDRNVTASLMFGEPTDEPEHFEDVQAFKVGGRGGQSARSIIDLGDGDALAGLLALLAMIYANPSGTLLAVGLYVFPVHRSEAA